MTSAEVVAALQARTGALLAGRTWREIGCPETTVGDGVDDPVRPFPDVPAWLGREVAAIGLDPAEWFVTWAAESADGRPGFDVDRVVRRFAVRQAYRLVADQSEYAVIDPFGDRHAVRPFGPRSWSRLAKVVR